MSAEHFDQHGALCGRAAFGEEGRDLQAERVPGVDQRVIRDGDLRGGQGVLGEVAESGDLCGFGAHDFDHVGR